MKILAIETSCDETSVALVDKRQILSNVLYSQVAWHAKHGGVVPDLARQKHKEFLPQVQQAALDQAGVKPDQIEAVAVTLGPGLAIALEVGIAQAKRLSGSLQVPLLPINHMEGHLLAVFATDPNQPDRGYQVESSLPFLSLLISGGHTEIVLVNRVGDYQILGQTLDDAVGEAFDKVGRMLGLTYPSGPLIEHLAAKGKARFDLPVPMRSSQDLNFSFSGLKTAVLYLIRDHLCRQDSPCDLKDIVLGRAKLDDRFKADLAASFQQAVIKSLTGKLAQAIKQNSQIKAVGLGGGVACNRAIREAIKQLTDQHHLPLLLPYDSKLYTDNAGMIGVAAWLAYQAGRDWPAPESLDRLPNWRLDEINQIG